MLGRDAARWSRSTPPSTVAPSCAASAGRRTWSSDWSPRPLAAEISRPTCPPLQPPLPRSWAEARPAPDSWWSTTRTGPTRRRCKPSRRRCGTTAPGRSSSCWSPPPVGPCQPRLRCSTRSVTGSSCLPSTWPGSRPWLPHTESTCTPRWQPGCVGTPAGCQRRSCGWSRSSHPAPGRSSTPSCPPLRTSRSTCPHTWMPSRAPPRDWSRPWRYWGRGPRSPRPQRWPTSTPPSPPSTPRCGPTRVSTSAASG